MGHTTDYSQYLPDLLLLAGVAYVAWTGWKKGLFIELFSLAVLALALFIGLFHYDLVFRFIKPYLASASIVAMVLSFLLTCFLVYKLFSLLGQQLKSALHKTPIGLFDNVAGLLFAFVKVTLAIYSVYWSVSRFAQPQFDEFLADHKVCGTLVGIGRTEFNWVRSGVTTLINYADLPTMGDLTSTVDVLSEEENP